MTEKEAGELVLLIAACHPSYANTRESAVSAAKLWKEVLGDMSLSEAKEHLLDHFRESEYLPKPVDLIRRAREKHENQVDDLVQLDMSSYWIRVGEARTFEEKISVYSELYMDLFANQLAGRSITREHVEAEMRDFVLEVPPTSRERSYRSSAIIYAFKHAKRFLPPEEFLSKAFERVEYLLRRDDSDR